ncbi:hypothetical protein Aph01nite_68570 [Acrocarpospora phusangensis]|uniref:NB-ARC domain-containing protein n=1 Tax=Acrocarpospora phusangensis TaxID=1070424 RepID=A0A919URY1_9ACTN|nr:tetratricopeptide repeat protein [Acrocarpospora phusangensis]GIH28547.1 hypothetical protein Aph01nite_68570 [Acrocarpospora phusangensis]
MRVVRLTARVVAAAAGLVAAGVAINQVLNGGVWSWAWLVTALVIAALAEAANQWMERLNSEAPADGETRDPASAPPLVLPSEAARPITEVEASPGLVNVPVRGQVFVGRDDELTDLRESLERPGPVVVAAVHGMGGVGKSTLAAQYAFEQRERFNPVWWITAETPANLDAGLAELAIALQPEMAGESLDILAERAVVWLASHRGWLLVLDNVSDPADVATLLGRVSSGRIVMTSRLGEGWHRLGADVLRLDVLSEQESIELLARIIGPSEPGEGAPELVRELGCLPLAVDQAAAFLHQTRLTPRAYLELLAEQPAVMYDQAARGADAERTIARIWRITLDQITFEFPLAGDVLRTLAWWGPEAIPRVLLDPLTRPMSFDDWTGRRTRRIMMWDARFEAWLDRSDRQDAQRAGRIFPRWSHRNAATDLPGLQGALGVLAAYNLISLDRETIGMHRLVQAVARSADPTDSHRRPADIAAALGYAVELLRTALHTDLEDPARWPLLRAALPHADSLNDHLANQPPTFVPEHPHRIKVLLTRAALVRAGLANISMNSGDPEQAAALYEQALAQYQQLWGSDHPATLATREYLGHALYGAGDFDQAITHLTRSLNEHRRVYGTRHPATITAGANLAAAHFSAGDHTRALTLVRQAIADHRILRDKPQTNDFTGTQNDRIAAIRALLDDLRQSGEPNDDIVVNLQFQLASWLGDLGDHEGLAAALDHLRTDDVTVFGDRYTYQVHGELVLGDGTVTSPSEPEHSDPNDSGPP